MKNNQKGFTFLLVLTITAFILVSVWRLIGVGLIQKRLYAKRTMDNQALYVAEAGINYYVWHLHHDPEDFFDGTGIDPGSEGAPYGPYIHEFDIPGDDLNGIYELLIWPPDNGNNIVTVESKGYIEGYPNTERTIEIKYSKISLSSYAFVSNDSVWFTNADDISGMVHSNDGIRMDGDNDYSVDSSREAYICGENNGCTEFNCTAPCVWMEGVGCECPGIWGEGEGEELWDYPVPVIDFDSITLDIAGMKEEAKNSGVYVYVRPGGNGCHIVFKDDGTFDAYMISSLELVSQWDEEQERWRKTQEVIKNEHFIDNYQIPDNGLIFVEGDVWVEGIVDGKVTLVAGKLPETENTQKSINIMDDLVYENKDGSNILGLIAQKDIKILQDTPNDLYIDAMLLAQSGRVYRNEYEDGDILNSVNIYGSIISYDELKWQYGEDGEIRDGFQSSSIVHDPQASVSPPPFFPNTGNYRIISWKEKF